ncbi:MAG: outer membrane beta-barrel protein [Cyclobacteriaceae bacterium]
MQGSYSYSSEKETQSSSTYTDKGHTISVGPQVRYYFPLNNNIAVFPQVSYSYGWSRSTFNDPVAIATMKSSYDVQTFFGGVGLAYFVRKNIGIEAIAGYKQINANLSQSTEQSQNYIVISFNFGIQFYLDRK